ncbi:cold-shock domain-containing protein [Gottschalkia acidurici 9a]|uniref:Cold-shock domain-containing protein n=1 Tax=Gottschalkia acidurici (strain ATCC 7906 / DSM 604 / BCRC 14475 / CIP 104303 / KCTC 5404 / NCIMB 10678 / 9a) TaxID=1128398 RepID=K0AYU6_GOTA9|nr:cold shock domain-containing protein [Gottschalkia acidurici]AFS77875.1 cold-shock domain-containing protein [Gottschalkia acidurici 9a]
MRGRVKKFERGLGVIISENKKEIPVHFVNIEMKGFKSLTVGQLVEYNIGEYYGKETAINVKVIDEYITPGMEINPKITHDVEDKGYWCKKGSKLEEEFVKEIVPKLKTNIIINPEKVKNPKVIDLLNLDLNRKADLKTQETPFFTAYRYGYNPQYTVTFNHKDYINYKKNYPNVIIYWWVNWKQLSLRKFSVDPLYGVWEIEFKFMLEKIQKGEAPLHKYKQRVDDPINATESYLFDLNSFRRLL